VARRDGRGVCHHVLLRGIERRAIFRDDVDRRDFVSRLRRQLDEGQGRCLAWALMTNHVHLVLRTGVRPLSDVMRRLNGGYARTFNLRHRRYGYLFQGRFRSILVEDDAYLRVLVRYVHLNPLRARMVDSLEALARYPWSGYAELMDHGGSGLLAKDELLALFGRTPEEARRALASWMEAGQSGTQDDACLPEPAAGSSAWGLEDAARDAPPRWEPSGIPEPTVPEIRARQLRRAGWTLDALIGWVCAHLGADPSSVRAGRRTLPESRARAVIGALATRELRLPLARVARATGVTSGPLCRAVERGARIALERELQLDELGPPGEARKATGQLRPLFTLHRLFTLFTARSASGRGARGAAGARRRARSRPPIRRAPRARGPASGSGGTDAPW
jgi:REP element-mobilizing transposase RayT